MKTTTHMRFGTARTLPGRTPTSLRIFVALLASLSLTAALAAPASAQDSKGTSFWLMFPGNVGGQELKLFIAGDTATTGSVEIPGLQFAQTFRVTPGSVTTVDLPVGAQQQSSDTVENLGIHVTAGAEVTVYGLNRQSATTDAFLGLPLDALGTGYINLGYQNVNVVNANQFGIVASQDATTVTITPTVSTPDRVAGTPYTVNMDQGQTYLLRDTNSAPSDLSGSIIASDKPVAVFGGHQCANIPSGHTACDHIVEQLPPTSQWGQSFLSMPLATRLNGDTFRILASEDGTTVQVNGSTVATLNRGQLHEQVIAGPARITADKPVLVMQYSNGESFDGDGDSNGDPFQMMIPPAEQYLPSYTVSTPAEGFDPNFINVIAPNSAVGSVEVDGTPIPAGEFTPIGGSGFSGAQVQVALGSHTVRSSQPIAVHSYGFGSFDSYGYPGGLSLSEVARVQSIVLTPKTATNVIGTEHCVDALVRDQNGNPLRDIRVDFTVSGANTDSGFAFTGQNGVATFCYTGSNAGDDQISAAVGNLADTAAKTWATQLPDTTPPDTPIESGPPAFGRDNTATFTFSSSHTGSTFECSLDGGPFFACTSPFTTPRLAGGRHTFVVRAIDAEGNPDPTPTVYTWRIAVELSELPKPVLGREVNVGPVPGSGTVYLGIPRRGAGASTSPRASQKGVRFAPLRQARQVPVGSFLKTRRGAVQLVSATGSGSGGTQTGTFRDGVFQVLQSRARRARGMTELRLKGSSFSRCRPGSFGGRTASAAGRLSRRTIRRLRGSARGRFRTRGRHAAATVRGTVWITADRCDGTLTTVKRGNVAVRDFRRKRTITVRAGKRYLARAPQ